YPLFRILDRDGYRHEEAVRDDGVVEIRITRP
ncbi:MAG: SirA-like protein, partial [Proteobacteria bacterium]|nr:SirA-like protein [Pseudomonadota bacterium]